MQHEPYIVGFIEADFDEMVPDSQRAELVCRVRVAVQLGVLVERSLVAAAKHPPRYRVSPGRVAKRLIIAATAVIRASVGHAFSMAERIADTLSGSSEAVSVVCIAAIPQPMSTPTAAGMMALRVGMTLPTVAPNPVLRKKSIRR